MTQYIILVWSSDRKVVALGRGGRTYKSALAAERACNGLQKRRSDLDFIVLPIEELEP